MPRNSGSAECAVVHFAAAEKPSGQIVTAQQSYVLADDPPNPRPPSTEIPTARQTELPSPKTGPRTGRPRAATHLAEKPRDTDIGRPNMRARLSAQLSALRQMNPQVDKQPTPRQLYERGGDVRRKIRYDDRAPRNRNAKAKIRLDENDLVPFRSARREQRALIPEWMAMPRKVRFG
jgi:hypothetical protein